MFWKFYWPKIYKTLCWLRIKNGQCKKGKQVEAKIVIVSFFIWNNNKYTHAVHLYWLQKFLALPIVTRSFIRIITDSSNYILSWLYFFSHHCFLYITNRQIYILRYYCLCTKYTVFCFKQTWVFHLLVPKLCISINHYQPNFPINKIVIINYLPHRIVAMIKSNCSCEASNSPQLGIVEDQQMLFFINAILITIRKSVLFNQAIIKNIYNFIYTASLICLFIIIILLYK